MISYLDTTIVIFLHAGDSARISRRAIEQIESTDLLISAMAMLELEMLYEKGAIRYPAAHILADLHQQVGLSVCQLSMAAIVHRALDVRWTPSPAIASS